MSEVEDVESDVHKYIDSLEERREREGLTFKHVFHTVGARDWIIRHFTDEHTFLLEVSCECTCNNLGVHEHTILATSHDDKGWRNFRDRKRRYLKRNNIPYPDKFDMRTQGNTSHLMNKILYIAGNTSKNYIAGRAKYVKDAHRNHRLPFTQPTEYQIDKIRKKRVEEDQVLQMELNVWKEKMRKQREERQQWYARKRVPSRL